MNLGRDLADSEHCRGLLVEKAADDEREQLPFARREGGVDADRKSDSSARACHVLAALVERRLDRAYQVGIPERFGQEIDCTCLDRPYRRRNVSVPRDEHNRRAITLSDLVWRSSPLMSGSSRSRTRQAGTFGFG